MPNPTGTRNAVLSAQLLDQLQQHLLQLNKANNSNIKQKHWIEEAITEKLRREKIRP